jgi:hypothetical protein
MAQNRVAELKVSGHLMNLEPGLFCIVQAPARAADAASGLPGVRLSVPPGNLARPDAVSIRGFREDGWLGSAGDAALVRVSGGAAQLLVTVYQAAGTLDSAPNLQVLRLLEPGSQPVATSAAVPPRAPGARPAEVMDILAHIQTRGDVGGRLGEWLGTIGSKHWIEGFAIAPTRDISSDDIEYQAVLGRGWLSPWVEGGQFCGSRGMALPLLGLRLRLRGKAAEEYDCFYTASFIDGTQVGPVAAGEPCEAESLAAVEAIKVSLRRKGGTEPAMLAEPSAAPLPGEAAAKSAKPRAAKAAGRPKTGRPG